MRRSVLKTAHGATSDLLQLRILAHQGLEHVTAAEAAVCGLTQISSASSVVRGLGSAEVLARLNMRLRSGLRVLQLLGSLSLRGAGNRAPDLIYQAAREIHWHRYFDSSQSFAIFLHGGTHELNDTRFGALKLKDAIADHFREREGSRPDVDKRRPDIPISLYLDGDTAEISLDSSGAGLHLRGYRQAAGSAPLRETLAAALLLHTGYGPDSGALLDPMCGSGTFVIEAAMIQLDRPVGLHRSFAFEGWKHVDRSVARTIRGELSDAAKSDAEPQVFASDIDASVLSKARANARRAGVEDAISFAQCDIGDARAVHGLESIPTGRLICNPPYGERMDEENVLELYEHLGDTLKQQFNGWEAWVLSASMAAFKRVGLRYDENVQLRTGGLDARFRKYRIF